MVKKKNSVVMSRKTILRLELLCKNSELGTEVPSKFEGFMAKIKWTPRTERLMKIGYMLIDKKPAHMSTAKYHGIIKSYPKGHALDFLPDWAIYVFERKI